MPVGKPVDVSDADFESEVMGSGVPVVVEFWSPKCVHCQRMANTVAALAEEFDGRVKVAKVNVLENARSPEAFGVTAIPAFFYIDDGRVLSSTAGAMSKGKLKNELGIK